MNCQMSSSVQLLKREGTQLLALADPRIQQIPRLWALVARIPSTVAITERQDALLGASLVFVATPASERGVEAVLGDRVEQGDGLEPVAAGPWTGVLDRSAGVDRRLHTGHQKTSTHLTHELVAVVDDLGEVVTGVDVHHRERQPSRSERQHG